MWLYALIPSLVGGLIATAVTAGLNSGAWTQISVVFLAFSFVLYIAITAVMHGARKSSE